MEQDNTYLTEVDIADRLDRTDQIEKCRIKVTALKSAERQLEMMRNAFTAVPLVVGSILAHEVPAVADGRYITFGAAVVAAIAHSVPAEIVRRKTYSRTMETVDEAESLTLRHHAMPMQDWIQKEKGRKLQFFNLP